MTRFLEHYRAWITPLSPVHIGTGEDYEPTNSVFLDHRLIHFDPHALKLSADDRRRLIGLLDGMEKATPAATLVEIRKFFERAVRVTRPEHCLEVQVPGGVMQHVRAADHRAKEHIRSGPRQNGKAGPRDAINRLAVPRAIRLPMTGELFLPGSSLKGALRTAWLERQLLDRRIPLGDAREVERELLGGAFGTDPFRLVKVGDSSGGGEGAVLLVLDVARGQPRKNDPAVMLMVEAALPGRVRPWQAGISLLAPDGEARHKGLPRQKITLADLTRAVNCFACSRWRAEHSELARNDFISKGWLDELDGLINGALRGRMDKGRAMILRLGHFSGLEFVSFGSEARRRTGNRPRQAKQIRGRDPTPCIRLAGRGTGDRDALPFGWVLVELAPEGEEPPTFPELEKFCASWGRWARGMAHGDTPAKRVAAKNSKETEAGGAAAAEIDIPESTHALQLRGLKTQIATLPPERYQQMVTSCVKQAINWPPAERAILVRLVEEHVRPKLGERAEKDHHWKQILQQVAKLKSRSG